MACEPGLRAASSGVVPARSRSRVVVGPRAVESSEPRSDQPIPMVRCHQNGAKQMIVSRSRLISGLRRGARSRPRTARGADGVGGLRENAAREMDALARRRGAEPRRGRPNRSGAVTNRPYLAQKLDNARPRRGSRPGFRNSRREQRQRRCVADKRRRHPTRPRPISQGEVCDV